MRLFNWLDRMMMVITFAEAGERGTALEVLRGRGVMKRKRVRMDRRPVLMA